MFMVLRIIPFLAHDLPAVSVATFCSAGVFVEVVLILLYEQKASS